MPTLTSTLQSNSTLEYGISNSYFRIILIYGHIALTLFDFKHVFVAVSQIIIRMKMMT